MQSTYISVVALVLQEKKTKKFFIAQRGPSQSGEGEWEFPGGKVEPEETQLEALVREIEEELNYKLIPSQTYYVNSLVHEYPTKTIELNLWQTVIEDFPEFKLSEHSNLAWVEFDQLKNYSLSQGDRRLLHFIY